MEPNSYRHSLARTKRLVSEGSAQVVVEPARDDDARGAPTKRAPRQIADVRDCEFRRRELARPEQASRSIKSRGVESDYTCLHVCRQVQLHDAEPV